MYVSYYWVKTILDHIGNRVIYLGMKVLTWYIDPNDIENKNIVKFPYPIAIKKCDILIIDTQRV